MNWLFFAILSPALFSVANVIDKFLVEKKIKDPMIITILSGILNFLLGIVIIIIQGLPSIPMLQLLLLLLSGVFLTFYVMPYFKALAIDDASRVIPLYQFIPVFVLILSYFLLGEKLSQRELIGFVIILIGGFILGAEKIESGIFKPRNSLYLMLIASLLYAVSTIVFKFVVIHTDFWTTFGYQSIGMGVGAFILLAWKPYRMRFMKEAKKVKANTWALLVVNDGFATSGEFAGAYALLFVPVALVTVIGGIQPFFVLLYALVLTIWFPHIIKEELGKSSLIVKISAIVLIFIGIYFVNL